LQADEEFWSPPTRRVAQVMAPLLLAGLGFGVLEFLNTGGRDSIRLIALWMVLYGGALHAAGFFMQRGLKLVGWVLCHIRLNFSVFTHHCRREMARRSKCELGDGLGIRGQSLAYGLYLKLTAKPAEEE